MKNQKISDIIERMKTLEQELQAELDKASDKFRYRLEDHKVRFERDILAQQKKFKENLARYILTARPKHLLTAPIIYAVAVPLLLLDLMVTLYQWICHGPGSESLFSRRPVRQRAGKRHEKLLGVGSGWISALRPVVGGRLVPGSGEEKNLTADRRPAIRLD